MRSMPIEHFKWGLEHEFPLIKDGSAFCDFSNTTFSDLESIVETLPTYPADYDSLRVGDLGIKVKRWYVEGFERFDETGKFLYAVPKGMEIRTPVMNSLSEAITTLTTDIETWSQASGVAGYQAAGVSFNPIQTEEFIPNPPENEWEKQERAGTSEYLHMLTYGPDINISHTAISAQDLVMIGKKLTFYSPYIVPFSFSSPFYKGELWGGLSRRTYYRTGRRPATSVFLPDATHVIQSTPSLTKVARVPSEVGRIEFKAFDMVADPTFYSALGTLLLGLVLDTSLPDGAVVPDQALHQKSAEFGFDDIGIQEGAKKVLDAVKAALPTELQEQLDPLYYLWRKRETPAHEMIEVYNKNNSVLEAITR